MKQVILKSLTLCNFKGEHNRTTQFNADVTTIAGANGLGKSRHFDAFLWLLFGKDKENRADYEIKTRDANGATAPQVDVVVTGVIECGGEIITLTRKLVENWVKPRMSKEQVFKGNETKCFWNDVPVSVTEYSKRVGGIMDEQLFKMITNPFYFVSLNWKMQREQLFAMAGEINDNEIVSQNESFAELVNRLCGKSFADYKAEIAAKKAIIRKELNEIQPRIDQTEAMKPESYDWIALAAEIDACDKTIAELDANIAKLNRISSDRSAQETAHFEEIRVMRRDLFEISRRMDDIINKAVAVENNRVRGLNAERESKILERSNIERKINNAKDVIATVTHDIDKCKTNINQLEKDRDAKRQEWVDVDAQQFNGDTTCPVCGQPLPVSMVEDARNKFADNKRARLDRIVVDGKDIADAIAKQQESIVTAEGVRNEWIAALDKEKSNLENINAEIDAIAIVTPNEINPESLPEWVKERDTYNELNKRIEDAEKPADNESDNSDILHQIKIRNADKAEQVAKRDALKSKMVHKQLIENADKTIAELTEKGRNLAQEIVDIERDEYTIGQYTKAKVDLVESRVAGLFKNVRFKMFDYTIDGNIVETCVATIDGKPFPTCNTANQVNAGLDIINALCAYYGIHAPIFIDNRESVNNLIPTCSQVINLVVTTDNELKVY